METSTIRTTLVDKEFRSYCRNKLVKECIKKKLPCSVYLFPFDEVVAGNNITLGLAKGLYQRIMEIKKEYERNNM